MTMNFALADMLMQFSAHHSGQISEEWYKALSTNPKTQAYRPVPREVCLRHAEFILKNLNAMYFAKDYESTVCSLLDLDGFVEDHYARNIPFNQILYAIVLLRRHLWLYAEFQALYNGIDDMMQMVDNINRVLLVFDYITYATASRYRFVAANITERHIINPGG